MSFQAMTWAVEQELPALQKLVLLMLANYCNHHTGQCNPSHDSLARECGMSRTAVKGAIRALCEKGALKIVHNVQDGVCLPNQYVLCTHSKIAPLPGRETTEGGSPDAPGWVGRRPGVGREAPQGGSPDDRGVGRHAPTNQEFKPGIEPGSKPGKEPTALSTSPPSASIDDRAEVSEIFAYWQKRMGSPRSKLDEKRRRAIKGALAMGYTPADLCRAIRGCSRTPHNMGQNDRGQKYNGIALILRSADQIDRFIANDTTPPRATGPANGVLAHNDAIVAAFLASDTPKAADPLIVDMEP